MRAVGIFGAIHLVGTALLMWLGYTWLGLGESRAGALLGSFVVALLFLLLVCWLYGASFRFFDERRVAGAFRVTLGRVPALAVAVLLGLFVYWLVVLLVAAADGKALPVASWLTLQLRKPVRPYTVRHVFEAVFWAIEWIVLPLLLLPMLAAISARGFRGFGSIGAGWHRRLYWLKTPVLVLLAIWVPLKLLAWAPHMKTFRMEMASFVARAAVAYLLFVAGWLALAFVTPAGKPVRTQPSTVPSP